MNYFLLGVVAIVALIAALLFVSATLKIGFDTDTGEFRCSIKYLFIKIVVSPKKKKKRKKRKEIKKRREKSNNEKKESTLKRIFDKKGLGGLLDILKSTVKNTWDLIIGVLKHARLRHFDVNVNVGGSDAADTAVTYGYANAVIYPIVSAILDVVGSYDKYSVDIKPDFSEGAKSAFAFSAVITLRPVSLLRLLLKFGVSTRNLLFSSSRKKQTHKGE